MANEIRYTKRPKWMDDAGPYLDEPAVWCGSNCNEEIPTVTNTKRIYISGPIRKGDLAANIQQADAAMLALIKAGFAPLNPMLTCFAGSAERGDYGDVEGEAQVKANGGFRDLSHDDWILADLPWVAVSEAVLRLEGESIGADLECEYAERLRIPVYHSLTELFDGFARREPVR